MPHRSTIYTWTISLSLVATTMAEAPGRGTAYPSRYRHVAPAHALLYQRVEEVVWDETPLEEVVAWLKDLSHGRVNVLPRWRALRQVGIDENTTVSFTLRDTNVAEVLAELIDQLDPLAKLAYQAHGNMFVFSSKAYFDQKLYLRVYDVTQHVTRVADNGGSAPVIDLSQTTGGGGGFGGGGTGTAGTVFGGGGGQSGQEADDRGEQERQERMDELIATIEGLIEPASWASAGQGRNGQIQSYDNMLLVLNTVEVHEQIAGRFVR